MVINNNKNKDMSEFNVNNWRSKFLFEGLDELSDKQQSIAKLRPPKNKLDGDDFKAMGAGEKPKMEAEDHEVGMALGSLEQIMIAAQELMQKLGQEERNIPGWIQDHITNSEQYLYQANKGFHENEPENNSQELPKLSASSIGDLQEIVKKLSKSKK
jgi:hypothetical protein